MGDPLFRTDRSVPPMPAQMRRLRDSYDEAIAAGVPESRLSVIGAEDAVSKIRVKNAQGALVERGVARIQPAKLVRGLADVVERRGSGFLNRRASAKSLRAAFRPILAV